MARPRKTNGTSAKADHDEAEAAETRRIAAEEARAEQLAAGMALATKTMTGDLRDLFLNMLRYEQDKRPWSDRSEGEQNETIHRVSSAIQESVKGAVELIAAAGLPTISATLDSVTWKDGLTLKILMDRSNPQRHQISDATGGTVLLVVADASEFIGERKPVEIKPDQMDIEDALVTHSDEAVDKVERRSSGAADEGADPGPETASDAPGWRPDRDATPKSPSPRATRSPLN